MADNQRRLTCPIRGCQGIRRSSMFIMCASHWYKVRRELRDKIWAAYRIERGSDNHRMLIDAAVQEVESEEASRL